MQYTETELSQLIQSVEKEFTAHLAKAEVSASSTLAKAEDSTPPKKEEEHEEEQHDGSEEAAPEEGQEEMHEEAAPEQEEIPAEGQAEVAAEGAGHGYDEEDMAHMLKMYQSMSRDELMAHHDCVRQCLDAMSAEQDPNMDKCGDIGMGKSEIEDENPVLNSKPHDKGDNMFPDPKDGGIEDAPPHNTPGAKSAASNANGAKINKSERARRNGGKIEDQAPGKTPGAKSPASNASKAVQMHKSEDMTVELLKSELEAEKAASAELKKSFDKATELLTNFVKKVTVPQGKAITELGVIAKGEEQPVQELSKAEVTKILTSKDQTKLTKSDREAINSYYLGGSDINTISHLLKN